MGQTAQVTRSDDEQKSGGSLRFLREVAIVVVCALLLSIVVRAFLFQAFFVPSQSMENTLMPDDRIIASKINTRIGGVDRGEVVVFKDPGGWLPAPRDSKRPNGVAKAMEFIGLAPSSSGDDLVKRVIGIGGDRVKCCNSEGQVLLNGVALDEASFVKPGSENSLVPFDIEVPEGQIFVLGDNRNESADSRYHLNIASGTVPVENVVGKVIWIVWPISSWAGVGTPEVFNNPALDNQSAGEAKV